MPNTEAMETNEPAHTAKRAKKDGITHLIKKKMAENPKSYFLPLVIHHLKILEKYFPLIQKNGPAAFPTRAEYQNFAFAKLFIDKLELLEFKRNSSLVAYKGDFVDTHVPPLESFHMTEEEKQAKAKKVINKLKSGTPLHCRVLECTGSTYEVLILNEYGVEERIIDYSLKASLIKNLEQERTQTPLKKFDLIRVTVMGRTTSEVSPSLLLSLNPGFLSENYKHLKLGLIFKKDIPFYPEDVSKCATLSDYLKAKNDLQRLPHDQIRQMKALNIDPLKVYSFHAASNGRMLCRDKVPSFQEKLGKISQSVKAIRKAEELLVDGNFEDALTAVQEAFRIYPNNDLAYGLRGKIYQAMANNMPSPKIALAINDFEEALKLNPNNTNAQEGYESLLLKSIKKHNSTSKEAEIQFAVQNIKLAEIGLQIKNIKLGDQNKVDSNESSCDSDVAMTTIKQEPVD